MSGLQTSRPGFAPVRTKGARTSKGDTHLSDETGFIFLHNGKVDLILSKVLPSLIRRGQNSFLKGITVMSNWLERTQTLIGQAALNKLQGARIAVLGLGGVGGAACEALLRAGVGSLLLIDRDTVSESNLNRQLFATTETVGMPKVMAAKKRLHSINPNCDIQAEESFYTAESRQPLFSYHPDFVIDAIDMVSAKLDLIEVCQQKHIPLISCLGTGNRLDPSKFQVGDISETAGCGCGLSRVMRRELKKRGITSQPVVFSTEIPRTVCVDSADGRHAPASISFCPPVAGCLLAGYAVNYFIQQI